MNQSKVMTGWTYSDEVKMYRLCELATIIVLFGVLTWHPYLGLACGFF
jgi:hypothetical protein